MKIGENKRFLQCSKNFLSWPLQWRSHANGFLNVRHIPFKNESKAVSSIYENASKMANDSNIASKIRKNTLSTPQDASKMLWQRLQDASKTHPTPRHRKKTEKMLQETWKICENIPTTLPRQPNTPPNHAPDAYKRLQNVSTMRWQRLRTREVNWSGAKEILLHSRLKSSNPKACRRHAFAVLTADM